MQLFWTAPVMALALLVGTSSASANACSSVDFRVMKVIESVFGVPGSELSPNALYVGKLAINDAKEQEFVSALEKEFGIRTRRWDPDAVWNKVGDTLVEVRRLTRCSSAPRR